LSGQRTSTAELTAALADPDRRLLVAERGGDLVGTVTVARAGADRAYLGMLSVLPDIQGAGLGRELIAAAEAAARTAFAAKFMEMTVIERRAELIGWYERRGYRQTGEIRSFPYAPAETVNFAMVVLERAL
jgi:ribosomal protein S18 acetylase RimI-like enzyme